MANYPQLDNASGVWNLREVYDAVMGGYWPNANSDALFGGGNGAPSFTSTIQKTNITSTGDATFFGDLTVARAEMASYSSFIRGMWAGGNNPGANNVIDYVTFSTQGNAADFGDLTQSTVAPAGSSNSGADPNP